jgi:hypothetical protein
LSQVLAEVPSARTQAQRDFACRCVAFVVRVRLAATGCFTAARFAVEFAVAFPLDAPARRPFALAAPQTVSTISRLTT